MFSCTRTSAASMTCSSNVACRVSCNVALNAATRSCGRWRINPTVSANTVSPTSRNVNTPQRRVEGGKQLVCRVDPRFGDSIERVDLPALVYPTSETVGTSALIRDCRPAHAAFQLFPARLYLHDAITQQTTVGFELGFTGPRKPIPPFCLSGGSSHAPGA